MTTPQHHAADAVVCSECGAENLAANERCWLCYRPLIVLATVVSSAPAKAVPVAQVKSGSPLLWGAALVALALLAMVGVGAFASDINLGIAYCVIMAPALVVGTITFLITHRRQAASTDAPASSGLQPAPVAAGLRSFFASLAMTIATLVVAAAVIVLVAVAAVIALIVTCFSQMGIR